MLAKQVAGSATYKQCKTIYTVLSFKFSLLIQFIQSWKQKTVCIFSLFKQRKKKAFEDISLLINISSTKLKSAALMSIFEMPQLWWFLSQILVIFLDSTTVLWRHQEWKMKQTNQKL